jgi:hypothetical protein
MKRRKKKKINDSLENNIQWVEVPLPAWEAPSTDHKALWQAIAKSTRSLRQWGVMWTCV